MEKVTRQVLCRGIEIVDLVEMGMVREDAGQLFLDLGEVDADASLIELVHFHLDLDLKGVAMGFLTLSLVFF